MVNIVQNLSIFMNIKDLTYILVLYEYVQ